MERWADGEIQWLINNYPKHGKQYCADYLGRSLASIRAKASRLGLKSQFKFNKEANYKRGSGFRGKKRPQHSEFMKKHSPFIGRKYSKEERLANSERVKVLIKLGKVKTDNFTGHKHTKLSKLKISVASKRNWSNPNSKIRKLMDSDEYRQKLSDNSSKMIRERLKNKGAIYSRAKNGWYKIKNKKYYFRSMWEVNYARYLQWLKDNKKLKKWTYEEDVFWFENIKRGVRSYCPDFKIVNDDGSIEYHEVKGYMDSKSKTKIKRMEKYYPEIQLFIIDKPIYDSVLEEESLYPKAKKIDK